MNRRYAILLILCFICGLLFSACSDNAPDFEPEPQPPALPDLAAAKRAVLIYAVNNSSLSYDFVDDRKEIEEAVLNSPTDCAVLLYCTDNDADAATYKKPVLFCAASNGEKVYWQPLMEYDASLPSTSPDRIRQVIADAVEATPNSSHNLFFWGHGSAWFPSGHAPKPAIRPDATAEPHPDLYGYGGEYGSDYGLNGYFYTDMVSLADAIPDNMFDLIWFDCCYMASIEVIYELQAKCQTFVGYPTEVLSPGAPYDRVLPLLLQQEPKVVDAAKTLFNYYNDSSDPVTIAVVDMSALEDVADAAKNILALGNIIPKTSELLKYSRGNEYYFYDFKDYLSRIALLNCDNDGLAYSYISELDAAMNKLIIYSAAGRRDFNNVSWDMSKISGLNTHRYSGLDTKADTFYRSLRWFSRVY